MLLMQTKRSSKLLSLLLVLLPIFNMYGLPGDRGTLADLALIVMSVIIIYRVTVSHTVKISPPLLFFAAYLFLDGIIVMVYTTAPFSQHVTYTLRYIVYFFIFAVGFKNILDINYTIKVYGFMCLISTVWLILQYVSLVFFGRYLPGFISQFVTRKELLTDYDYIYYSQFYRPRSFFEEPAHYATFVVGFLIILLLTSDTSKKIWLKIFLSFGIVLSGSTAGLAMLALAWLVYVGKMFKEKRIGTKTLLLVIGLVGALYVALQSSTAQILIRRTFKSNEASSGRFENVMAALSPRSTLEFFFGRGAYVPAISEDIGWLPGWPLIYKCYGTLGLLILLIVLFMLFRRANKNQRMFIILFVLLNVGTEMLTMSFVFPYMAYIVCGALLDKESFNLGRNKNAEIRADITI